MNLNALCQDSRHCILTSADGLSFFPQGKILVGTKESEFIEITEKTGEKRMITNGHGEGELWGLATHPTQAKFMSASEDGTLRVWDIPTKVNTKQYNPTMKRLFNEVTDWLCFGV